jgi:hypothetical protein
MNLADLSLRNGLRSVPGRLAEDSARKRDVAAE